MSVCVGACESFKDAFLPDSEDEYLVTVVKAPVVKGKEVTQQSLIVSWRKKAANSRK